MTGDYPWWHFSGPVASFKTAEQVQQLWRETEKVWELERQVKMLRSANSVLSDTVLKLRADIALMHADITERVEKNLLVAGENIRLREENRRLRWPS
jgi:hypothetical protein